MNRLSRSRSVRWFFLMMLVVLAAVCYAQQQEPQAQDKPELLKYVEKDDEAYGWKQVKKTDLPEGAAASFEAGADILLICRDQNKVLESVETLRTKLIRGEIPFQRLQESLDRIDKTKSRFLAHRKKISLSTVAKFFQLQKRA